MIEDLDRDFNDVSVRSFVLTGAPLPPSTYRTTPFERRTLKRFFKRFLSNEWRRDGGGDNAHTLHGKRLDEARRLAR